MRARGHVLTGIVVLVVLIIGRGLIGHYDWGENPRVGSPPTEDAHPQDDLNSPPVAPGSDTPQPEDVFLYMVDTGIDFSALEPRAESNRGYSSVAKEPSSRDCNGHGTFTASVAERYLTSPEVQHIVPVKVVGCSGGGGPEDVVRGLDWILQTHPRENRAVVNISLAGLGDTTVRAAIDRLSQAGVVVVVAAGNYEDDVCRGEYAMQNIQAITVGALDASGGLAPSSGYGDCLTVYATGVDVEGAWIGGDKNVQSLSGTSVAAPRVSGKVLNYLTTHPYTHLAAGDLKILVGKACGSGATSIHGIDSAVC